MDSTIDRIFRLDSRFVTIMDSTFDRIFRLDSCVTIMDSTIDRIFQLDSCCVTIINKMLLMLDMEERVFPLWWRVGCSEERRDLGPCERTSGKCYHHWGRVHSDWNCFAGYEFITTNYQKNPKYCFHTMYCRFNWNNSLQLPIHFPVFQIRVLLSWSGFDFFSWVWIRIGHKIRIHQKTHKNCKYKKK